MGQLGCASRSHELWAGPRGEPVAGHKLQSRAAAERHDPVADADPYQVQLKLEQTLIAGDISKQTHETIEERIVTPQAMAQFEYPSHPANVNVIAGLLLGSPEFQRK